MEELIAQIVKQYKAAEHLRAEGKAAGNKLSEAFEAGQSNALGHLLWFIAGKDPDIPKPIGTAPIPDGYND